jgi:hypothetical protein
MDLVDLYRMVDGTWLIGTELWMDLVDLYRTVDGMWLIGTELLMDFGLVGTERLKDVVIW